MPSKRAAKIILTLWVVLFLWNAFSTVLMITSEAPWWAFFFMSFATGCAGWVAIERYEQLLKISR